MTVAGIATSPLSELEHRVQLRRAVIARPAARPRPSGAARDRRLGDADSDVDQHQCSDDHDGAAMILEESRQKLAA